MSFPWIFSNTGLMSSPLSRGPRMECKSPNEKEGSLSGAEVIQLLGLFLTKFFTVIGPRDKIL